MNNYAPFTHLIKLFSLCILTNPVFIFPLSSCGQSTTGVPCVKSGRMWPLWDIRRTHTHCGWHIQSEVQMDVRTPPFPYIMRWWATTLCWGPIMTSTWWNIRSSALTWTPKCSWCLKVCKYLFGRSFRRHKGTNKPNTPPAVFSNRHDLRWISWSRIGAPHVGQSNERSHTHLSIGPRTTHVWPFQGDVPAAVQRWKGAREEGARFCS